MSGAVAAVADGLLTLRGTVARATAGVASGGGLAVAGFVVAPPMDFAVLICFGWWRWWTLGSRGEEGERVEGVSGRVLQVVFVPAFLPLDLRDQPFEGVGLPEIIEDLGAESLDFIEAAGGVGDELVEAGGLFFHVPSLVHSSGEGRVVLRA